MHIILPVIIVFAIVAVVLFLKAPGASARAEMEPFCQVPIAHRGYFDNGSNAPENSLAAFQAAIDHGYAIELDVQLTADGTPVVLHDRDLVRSSGVHENVSDMTDAELAKCRLFGTDEKVPTFAEVLDLIDGQVPVLVEIKGEVGDDTDAISSAAAEVLDEYDGVYAVQSFNPLALKWFKDNRPDVTRGLLCRDYIADGLTDNAFSRIVLTAQLTNFLARPNFISYELSSDDQVTFKAIQYFTDLPCLAWTLKSQDDLDRARTDGFDGFIFDSFEAKR